ncbi:MAG: hypothetical protein U0Y68_16205 [Blastocatellia bacterium]
MCRAVGAGATGFSVGGGAGAGGGVGIGLVGRSSCRTVNADLTLLLAVPVAAWAAAV